MASFGIGICSLLAAAFLFNTLRYVDGGRMIKVGGDAGWQYSPSSASNLTSAFNYQDWMSKVALTDTDALDFGVLVSVRQVSWEAVEQCDASGGSPPIQLGITDVVYNLSGSSGPIGFISPMYCAMGLKFVANVPASDPTPGDHSGSTSANFPKKKQDQVVWIVVIVIGVSVGLAVLSAFIFLALITRRRYWQRLRKSTAQQGMVLSYTSSDSHSNSYSGSHLAHVKDVEAVDIAPPHGPHKFSYEELIGATDNFNSSLIVGEGGFGTVYKGYLRDSPHPPVAVKRLSQYALQGAREFMAEVNIISQLRHRNLVPLLGWCHEHDELILVYEYMSNGDLDDLIFGDNYGGAKLSPLSWKHRYNIFCGVANALVYLHEEWEQRILHRDVKTSNVLLDAQFEGRLGDFGLARLSAHSQAPKTTMVAGTIGYLAPEFGLTGRATDKTDVYAFGVVVLEVSCARRTLTSKCILVDWVWDLHKEAKLLDAMDPKLEMTGNVTEEEEMKLALKVGLLCCHPDPAARPSMRDVLSILTGKTPLPKMPRSKPIAVFPEDG